ncbi:hypothetical protein GGX14DRAFT_701595 [Mycena pura]|uniref:DUF6534 domain-containing protein n=1 Tax=Mycena pura TaxID=153505 RepID=A0AAD6USI7_9AGAR|nr:hypothetical protein GGX14DRAFT_701595 [Mycena pura]
MSGSTFQYPPGYVDAVGRPIMIGYMLSTPRVLCCPLYAIVLGQSFYYFRAFPDDSVYMKMAVAFLLVVDTVHTVLLTIGFNRWFFDLFLAPTLPKTYAARIWFVGGKNKFATGLVVLFSSAQIIAGFVMGMTTYLTSETIVAYVSRTFRISGVIELSSSLACDVSIVAAMVYFLKGPGRGSAVQRTTNIVNKLIVYVISVGVLTSAATVANLVLWLAFTSSFDFMILHLIMGKLYSNSLLVMLNSRVKLREQLYDHDTAIGIELGTARGMPPLVAARNQSMKSEKS